MRTRPRVPAVCIHTPRTRGAQAKLLADTKRLDEANERASYDYCYHLLRKGYDDTIAPKFTPEHDGYKLTRVRVRARVFMVPRWELLDAQEFAEDFNEVLSNFERVCSAPMCCAEAHIQAHIRRTGCDWTAQGCCVVRLFEGGDGACRASQRLIRTRHNADSGDYGGDAREQEKALGFCARGATRLVRTRGAQWG